MKKPTKPKKPKDKKPGVKTQTDPYCPPGEKWDNELKRCIPDIGKIGG